MTARSAWGGERLPVPGKSEQATALKQIKELFAAEYAENTPRSHQALADKLWKAATDSNDDVVRYVLLGEVRDVACGMGNARLGLAAAKKIDALYETRGAESLLAALTELKKASLSPVAAGDAALAVMSAADKALVEGDIEAANRLALGLSGMTGSLGDAEFATAARQKAADIRAAAAESGRIAADRKVLQSKPDDPRASLAVGRFVAFTLGQWKEGCALLANVSDPALQELAVLDHSETVDPHIAAKLGDGWTTIAQSAHGMARDHLLERAAMWYRRALPELTGLEKMRVSKRIAAARVIKPWESASYLTSKDGKGIEIGMIERNATRGLLIQFDIKTKATYSAVLLTKRMKEGDSGITVELTSHGAVEAADDGSFYKKGMKGKTVVNDGKWHTVRIEKQGQVLRMYVDDVFEGFEEVRESVTSQSPWTLGYHGAWDNGAVDAEFRHVRIEGGR